MPRKVIIIAEAGVNHNGDMDLAKALIDAAADAGVDYVKFQTFSAEKLVSKDAKKADYQSRNIGDDNDSQFEMLKSLELSPEQHLELIAYCNEHGLSFFSTAFDLDSLQFLHDIGLKMVKIPSGELTNLPYLELAAKIFESVILSTGMATLEEINAAVDVFINNGIAKDQITILHCNTEYPTPYEDVNLKAMLHIQMELKTEIGYSDHTLGIEVPIAAVALGAKVIEKHFTLDRNLPGPDHRASLEPEELKAMVQSIRNIELAISGTGFKEPSTSELKNIKIARKSIFINKNLMKGHLLAKEDFVMLRPGNGISPMELYNVLGKVLRNNKNNNDILKWEDLN